MLTRTQRNFRKEIKRLEKEKSKYYEDIYSYKHKRFESELRKSYKKPIITISGIIGICFLLWNVFAVSTWISPFKLSFSTGMNQQKVASYLKSLEYVKTRIKPYVQKISEPNLFDSSTDNSLLNEENDILSLENNLNTNLPDLYKLKQDEFNSLEYLRNCIEDLRQYKITGNINYWNAAKNSLEQYNANSLICREDVISILNKYHMPYTIDGNNTIHYSYISN
jgi:hypothetical protein